MISWESCEIVRVADFSCRAHVTSLFLDRGANLWVGAGRRGTIQFWRADTMAADPRQPAGILEGHTGEVTGIAVDDEGHLVSSSLATEAGVRALWRSRACVRL